MKSVLILLFILNSHIFVAQEIVKKWQINHYTVQLVKYENITEDVGIEIYPQGKAKSYYQVFEITNDSLNFERSGHIRVNKDSTKLYLIEVALPRSSEGVMGSDVTIDLATNSIQSTPIIKPQWLWQDADSAILIRLSDDSTQRLVPKMTDAILLFGRDQTMNLRYKYIPSEWKVPNIPNYKVLIYQKNKQQEILFYSNYYIMDGYVFATWGGLGQARGYGEGFWNSNIYLREQERKKNDGDQ
ncbi:MAG: hypothetical protein RL137_1257 [Bacteroidota bacterium]|jgi:hypothetical protein